jgi:PAS domain S-box-containing protein
MNTPTKIIPKKQSARSVKDCTIHHLAFDYTALANIITIASNGKIIIVNNAACKLLGYAKKELLAQSRTTIFNVKDAGFKKMLKQRAAEGHSEALVTAIKKTGEQFLCEITSAIFMDQDGIEKAIFTITDMRQRILKQKNIDTIKEKIVADNIVLAKSKQKKIDIINKKIVAADIILALAKSEEEKLEQEITTRKKMLIELEKRLRQEIKLKEKQISDAAEDAKDTERADIGKELHDNVNQLLGASRLYLDMAKREGADSAMYLSRSSEYTLNAIEEIRKLTKGLTTDTIKNLGLREAIDNVSRDTMETNPLTISCSLDHFAEDTVNDKFKLTVLRIVQEQLNNILKHAHATKVAINLLQDKKVIRLTISDNGIGFDTEKKRIGIGVANIKSRAAFYNGTADFISQPGQGCILNVIFPVTKTLLNKNEMDMAPM